MRISSEADAQGAVTRFLRSAEGAEWARENAGAFFVCELKVVRHGKRGPGKLRLSQVEEHQRAALANAGGTGPRGLGLIHQISDSALGLKPFDFFYAAGCPAFLGVCWLLDARGSSWSVTLVPWGLLAPRLALGPVGLEEASAMGIEMLRQ